MGLAVNDEHVELAGTVRRWAEARKLLAQARSTLEAPDEALPEFWAEMGELGWMGLAVSAEQGGSGFGLVELAVVLEELGRWCTPGPVLPTAIVATALDRWSLDGSLARALAEGAMVGGFALHSTLRLDDPDPGFDADAPAGDPEPGVDVGAPAVDADPVGGAGRVIPTAAGRVTGRAVVWSGARAGRFLLPVGDRWCVIDRDQLDVVAVPSFDATRRLAEVRVDTVVPADRWLSSDAEVGRLAAVLVGAEAVGVADWCVGTAATYAADRVQFGRPIGQFQAVKHRCADMLVANEMARAAVWDAARCFDAREPGWALAADAAGAVAPEAAFRCAKDAIQVLGGIGYTWEHDAHLFLKRATAVRHLLPEPSVMRASVAAEVVAGETRSLTFDLPPEADAARTAARAFCEALRSTDKSTWRAQLADSGYLVPHWPRPWGLDATAVEQLAIDAELKAARIVRPHLTIAGWVLPTLIAHGSTEQQEQFIGPSLRGEIMWCQMFSEPGAGSDLASLTTKAERVEGGWLLTGQKVWTTLAHQAQWGMCLARTDPAAERHDGIGCFLVDMTTEGLDVRPLRELTGMAMFNEIFLTEVYVPDECVVGSPTDGWVCARTTLANERVSMAQGATFGPGVASLFALAAERGVGDDALVVDRLGALVVDAHAISSLGVRTTLRALAGGQPGPEASVRKLANVEHEQLIQEVGLSLLGPDAARLDGAGAAWTGGFLGNRALSIAGGTSEIQRNVIAERLLGLPKDP